MTIHFGLLGYRDKNLRGWGWGESGAASELLGTPVWPVKYAPVISSEGAT